MKRGGGEKGGCDDDDDDLKDMNVLDGRKRKST